MSGAEARWVRLTACENIPLREGRLVEIAGHQLAVFNLGERFLAIENRCPHRGGPLADGIVTGQMVVCPLHAWKFDLVTGKVANHPESQACAATFPARMEDGAVLVEIPVNPPDDKTTLAQCGHRDRPLRWVQRKPLLPATSEIHQAEQ